jgi:hypothetical protein
MEPRAVVVPPGQGHRVGNVEFLARTAHTPRFTFGIIEISPGRVLEAHVHEGEDDAFNIHAPAGFRPPDRPEGLVPSFVSTCDRRWSPAPADAAR